LIPGLNSPGDCPYAKSQPCQNLTRIEKEKSDAIPRFYCKWLAWSHLWLAAPAATTNFHPGPSLLGGRYWPLTCSCGWRKGIRISSKSVPSERLAPEPRLPLAAARCWGNRPCSSGRRGWHPFKSNKQAAVRAAPRLVDVRRSGANYLLPNSRIFTLRIQMLAPWSCMQRWPLPALA